MRDEKIDASPAPSSRCGTASFYVFTTFVVGYATGSLSYNRVTVLDR
jgi:hypothetical protein